MRAGTTLATNMLGRPMQSQHDTADAGTDDRANAAELRRTSAVASITSLSCHCRQPIAVRAACLASDGRTATGAAPPTLAARVDKVKAMVASSTEGC
jgi:hypothetical protein